VAYRDDDADRERGPLGRVGATFANLLGFEDDGPQLLLLVSCLFIVPTVGWLVGAGFAARDEANLVTEMVLAG
jgi:hypothetical protein